MQRIKAATALMLVAAFLLLATMGAAQTTQLAQLAAANPQNPHILNSYGIEQAGAGDLIGAIGTWRRALDFDRGNVHLYNNIGSALKRLGQDEHAYAWYAEALKIKPVYWTYYNLAILYCDRGQNPDAMWAVEQALQLNPQFAEALDLRRRITAARHSEPMVIAEQPFKKPISSPSGRENAATLSVTPTQAGKQAKVADYARPRPVINPAKTVPVKKVKETPGIPLKLPGDTGGQVFLTFDGGSTDDGFDSIVASLKRHGVRCTFFLTGKFVRKYPEKSRRLLQEGHEIANHSMNHPDMKKFSREKIAQEIEAAETVFAEILGKRGAPFFRFPFGAQNKTVERIVEELGYRPVYWHIDTIDWREDPVPTIIGRVDKKLRRNAVILMHLGSKNGAKALDRILNIIITRGYTPVRLSELDASQLAEL